MTASPIFNPTGKGVDPPTERGPWDGSAGRRDATRRISGASATTISAFNAAVSPRRISAKYERSLGIGELPDGSHQPRELHAPAPSGRTDGGVLLGEGEAQSAPGGESLSREQRHPLGPEAEAERDRPGSRGVGRIFPTGGEVGPEVRPATERRSKLRHHDLGGARVAEARGGGIELALDRLPSLLGVQLGQGDQPGYEKVSDPRAQGDDSPPASGASSGPVTSSASFGDPADSPTLDLREPARISDIRRRP